MGFSLNQINQRIARDISPLIELVRGAGYHYFVYDNTDAGDGIAVYETHSVMVFATKQLTFDQWLEEAQTFANAMEVLVSERLAIKAEIREAQTAVQAWRESEAGAKIAEAWASSAVIDSPDGQHHLGVALYGGGPVPDGIARFWLSSHAGRAARALSAAGLPITVRDERYAPALTFWFVGGKPVHAEEARAMGLPFTTEETKT